jgi:hypothetical protein
VSSLELAGASGALDNINATQAEFRAQIAALNDLMRQVAGTANVAAGSSEMVDPLTAPFTLYVNPYIGEDTFAAGSYNTYEAPGGSTDEEIIEAKLKRLDKQRLTCGFSPQRPFKTINRAVIEAAIITSKNWYTITDPKAHLDCVSIILAPGVHTVYNDPGSGTPVTWTDGYEPTPADLTKFNPTDGGVLLPRGCSLCGPDLRKCTFRPTYVPTNADEAADRSNRSEIFKITGTGYFFGFTFFDKINSTDSHHLLSAFGFASKAELDAFYTKIRTYVGSPANLSNALAVTRNTEYEIVGPIDDTPSADWDTTQSASPYIFNCSVRSEYGMGGIHADGAKVTGLKSMVTANYTGVSLQKDMSCWQLYSGGAWITMPDYTTYINSDPNDVRMNPARRSYHIRAINNAFIQEVSIFAIGQGVHHATESGAEVTITNSNSSFGGCVAIASGYKSKAFDIDTKWRIAYFNVPLNISEKTNNIQKYYLGNVSDYTDEQPYLNIETALTAQDGTTNVPSAIGQYGYTLRPNSYVWVENLNGNDFRVRLSDTRDPWNTSDPDRIYFKDGESLQAYNPEEDSEQAPGSNNFGVNNAVGRRVYIRRMIDARNDSERKLTIGMFSILASTRLAQRDYILQLDPSPAVLVGDVDPYVSGPLPADVPLAISSVISKEISDANYSEFTGDIEQGMEIQLVRNAPETDYAVSTFYRAGTTVIYANKHYTAIRDVTTASSGGPSADDWDESYVHMAETYRAADKIENDSYRILFDDDDDDSVNSTTLGYNLSTLWTEGSPTAVEALVQQQYRTSNDYLAAYALLRELGFSEAASHAALQPRASADRIRRTNSTTHFPTAPSGGLATARKPWAAEFRRPSVLRLFGHAFEWAGTLNYSKAFPAVQRQLSPINKFTYYFTNELGGRAYATGFNEEGYLVKPTGIEDISTGQSRSITSLAAVDEEPTNSFPTGIDAGGTSFFNDIEIAGEATFNFAATTESLGPVQIAAKEILESDNYPSKNGAILTEDEFNVALNNGNQPNVVTLEGLNYWREYNSVLSGKALSFEIGTDADEIPVSGMLGRMAFVDEWCGYARGGGSVTQANSSGKATGVELNTPCGQITMDDDALAADTAVAFTLTNSQIAPQDVVAVSIKSGATAGAYAVSTLDIASGSVKIVLRNLTAGSLSEAVVLNFVIIKSTTTA